MNKLELVKLAANLIVTVGTGKIVTDVITNNTNPDGVVDKATYTAGSYAIGGLVAVETSKFTDAKINEIAAQIEKFRASLKKN